MKIVTRKELSKIYTKVINEKFEFAKKYRGEEEARDFTLQFANAISEFLKEVEDITKKEVEKLN